MLGGRAGSGKQDCASRAASRGIPVLESTLAHRPVRIVNTAVAGAAAAPRSFKEVWLISAGHAFTHWYTATFYLLLPLIGKELGLSYTEIGLIMAIQNGVGALSNIPGGMVVDMVGKKG